MRLGSQPAIPQHVMFEGNSENRKARQRTVNLIGAFLIGVGIGNGVTAVISPDLGTRIDESWDALVPLAAGISLRKLNKKDQKEAAQEDTFVRQAAPSPEVQPAQQDAVSALLGNEVTGVSGKKAAKSPADKGDAGDEGAAGKSLL